MDLLKTRLFIKDLVYDSDTVRFLLDYNRLKETLPIMAKILDDIDLFRKDNPDKDLIGAFPDDLWTKKSTAANSFSQMRAFISKNVLTRSPLAAEGMERIGYRAFVKDVLNWVDDNIPKLRRATRSPWCKKLKRTVLILAMIAAGSLLVIYGGWLYHTRHWGLKGDFYLGEHFDQYLYSGDKKTIDFSSPKEMDQRLPNDHFSDRWRGYLLVPQSGDYTISVYVDDWGKVFVDGKLLLTGTWYGGESFAKIFLSQGSHRLYLEHSQKDGPAALQLYWSLAGGEKKIIPAKYLRH